MRKVKKSRMMSNINSVVSADIIGLIISKVSFLDLYSCFWVCKAWKKVVLGLGIQNHLFVAFISRDRFHYRERLQFVDFDPKKYLGGVTIFESKEPLTYFPSNCSSKYHGFYMANSCRGLLCYYFINVRYKTSQVYLFNPITNEHIKLPSFKWSKGYEYEFGLGFSPKTMHYKIVRLSVHKRTSMFIDIFSFETPDDAGWTRVAHIPMAIKLGPIAYFNGALYWVGSTTSPQAQEYYRIYRFDLEHYTWDYTPFHQPGLLVSTSFDVLNGALHLSFNLDFDYYTPQVWRLNNVAFSSSSSSPWIKLFHLPTLTPIEQPEWEWVKLFNFQLIKLMEDGNILCLFAGLQLILYHPTTGTLQELPHPNPGHREYLDIYPIDFFHFDSLRKLLLPDA